jgi:hypothetical protein
LRIFNPNPLGFVIPGLTRNPVFLWMPVFEETMNFAGVNVVVDGFLKVGFSVAGFQKWEYRKN